MLIVRSRQEKPFKKYKIDYLKKKENINKKGGLCAWHLWQKDRSMFWGEGAQGVRAGVAAMTHRTPAPTPSLFPTQT